MKIGEIVKKEPVIATQDDSVLECAQLMREHHVGDVIIVEQKEDVKRPVGIATDRDIVVSMVAEGATGFRDTPIKNVMTSPIIVAETNDQVDAVLQNMKANGVRRIPVVDKHNNIAGLVSFDDMVQYYGNQIEGLSELLNLEIEDETARDSV